MNEQSVDDQPFQGRQIVSFIIEAGSRLVGPRETYSQEYADDFVIDVPRSTRRPACIPTSGSTPSQSTAAKPR